MESTVTYHGLTSKEWDQALDGLVDELAEEVADAIRRVLGRRNIPIQAVRDAGLPTVVRAPRHVA